MNEKFIQDLMDPPKKYRPIPFWSWNEKLDLQETRWQIEQMDGAGIGGYFMHARGGLQTEYMGKEWMDNITVGIREGQKRDMGAWGYDENGWPSGFGSGLVNGLGEKYQQKYLRFEQTDKAVDTDKTIVNLPYKDGNLHFYYQVNPFYVDTLDAEVTDKFIQQIHEKYQRDLGEAFKGMAGFFTDEPQVSRNGIPWSLILPDEYKKVYGQDLLQNLDALFFEREGYEQVRVRFWALIRDLFTDNFMKRIYDWCQKNQTRLTGHIVQEETMHSQLVSNGACMPSYEFMDIPGMDWLGRSLAVTTTPMQLSSVAHQLGKKQILSETFALSGWNVSFEELKWIYEYQMVRGITLLCQHLEGYSLRGIRKRDYPASLFYQQPWWKEYKQFNDAVSRIGMLLSEGRVDTQVLLLHQQSSAWVCFNCGSNDGLDDLDDSMLEVATLLENQQIPYHFGDERIIARHGSVKNQRFSVGCQNYSIVIVPPSINISKTVLEMLEDFQKNNGKIIWNTKVPYLVDGQKSDGALLLAKKCIIVDQEKLPDVLGKEARVVDLKVEGGDGTGIAVAERFLDQDSCRMYYFVNSNQEARRTSITMKGKSLKRFNYETGKLEDIPYSVHQESITVNHLFQPMGSVVLFAYDVESEQHLRLESKQYKDINDRLSGTWSIHSSDENAVALDYCDCYFDGISLGKHMHINSIQEKACALGKAVKVEMVFELTIGQKPDTPMYLVLETPEIFKITVNSQEVENIGCGYYFDKSFVKIDITNQLAMGNNQIRLEVDFYQSEQVYQNIKNSLEFESERNKLTYDMELEAIYVVGQFGVKTSGEFGQLDRRAVRYDGSFEIIQKPCEVEAGNLVCQGFPMFSGTMTLQKKITLTEQETISRSIRFDKRCATVTKVRVNGKDAGQVIWSPYEVSLDGLLEQGENLIEIELIGTLRNLLGPHHFAQGESYMVCPFHFYQESPVWVDGINHEWDDRYTFVEFGICL